MTVEPVDQRGAVAGPLGLNAGASADIGAYEASSSYLVSLNADNLDVGTLRTGVGWANISTNANPANLFAPAPNTVSFSPTSFGPTHRMNLTGGVLALTSGTSVAKSIEGPGATVLTISGNSEGGVFSVADGVSAVDHRLDDHRRPDADQRRRHRQCRHAHPVEPRRHGQLGRDSAAAWPTRQPAI